MSQFDNVLQSIGRTPLIALNRVTAGLSARILAKVESLNPGGSVKDRIGLAMIQDAEQRGLLRPGGTIIEATAGNTGVALALVAAVRGYRCIFVLPDKMSADKVNLLRAYGSEVIITPTSVPPDSPDSYNGVADRLAREIPGAFRPNQFANTLNPEAHYATTGPEIWEDTAGDIGVFVAGMGTGGTISGVGRYLKERNPQVRVIGADPEGSVMSGDTPRPFQVEGIGGGNVPATLNRQVIDDMVRVSDAESFAMARRLAREEGLLVGGSAGTAVVAAVRYAERVAPGTLIVVLLPDSGRNYLTKIFSDAWMQEHGYLSYESPRVTAGEVLRSKRQMPALISVAPHETAASALATMEGHSFSLLPVVDSGVVVGSLSELTLLKLLRDGVDLSGTAAAEVMAAPPPLVNEATDINEVYRLLLGGHSGVVVSQDGSPHGFLARIDLAHYWSEAARDREDIP